MKQKRENDADAAILLRLVQKGLARFEVLTGKFCFQGMRYGASAGDWSRVIDVIGRGKINKALDIYPPSKNLTDDL